MKDIRARLEKRQNLVVTDKTRNVSFEIVPQVTERAAKIILAGGLLKYSGN